MNKDHPLWPGLNRLLFIVTVLLGLKLLVYTLEEFLPMFGTWAGKVISALLPFIIAFAIAFLIEPIVVRVMKYLRLNRVIASIITLVLVIGIIGLGVFWIVARLYSELSELSITLPNYDVIVDFINDQIHSLEGFINADLNMQIKEAINESSADIANTIASWAASGSKYLLNIISGLPGFLIVIVISAVATVLTSIYFPGVKTFIKSLIPVKWQKQTRTVSRDLEEAIFGFLRAEFILVSVTGICYTIGLTILGSEYAVTLGVLSAILDLLPIVGTAMIYVPWGLFLILTGSVSMGIKILILFAFVLVLRYFLEPKVMSKGIGLHPLATLISMYVGLELFGGLGIILGPSIVIVYEAMRKAGIINYPRI